MSTVSSYSGTDVVYSDTGQVEILPLLNLYLEYVEMCFSNHTVTTRNYRVTFLGVGTLRLRLSVKDQLNCVARRGHQLPACHYVELCALGDDGWKQSNLM